ncbi:hypothetical protein NKH70_22860 [Mesorhizobium sp. M0991]|uniref:hypothetical protein n=1 Tax=Mesorhizobium sp. M0991 TaxID=2957043 RepID=UPI00333D69AE
MSNVEIVGSVRAEDSYVDERPWYQEFSFSAREIGFFCKASFSRIDGDFYSVSTMVACQARRE